MTEKQAFSSFHIHLLPMYVLSLKLIDSCLFKFNIQGIGNELNPLRLGNLR